MALLSTVTTTPFFHSMVRMALLSEDWEEPLSFFIFVPFGMYILYGEPIIIL